MKFENFNNFEEYFEAKQRWAKNPNDTNAGYLLALSQSLLNQAFVAQREEEQKVYDEALKEKENQKVVDTDGDARVHITIDEYFEWLDHTVETLLIGLNKDLIDNVSYRLETYLLGVDQSRTHVTSNIEQWKKKTNKLKIRINALANEAHNMRKIPKSDDYQSVKDNYESELCYSEFLISIITKVINNDPRATADLTKDLTQSIALPNAKADGPKTVVPKVGTIGVPSLKNDINGNLSNGIYQSTDALFGINPSDDLAARLKKEIKKGLGQISGGLR